MATPKTKEVDPHRASALAFFQIPAVRQIFFIVGMAISIALGITLYISIQEPTYQPLDFQITSQNMGSVVETLEKSGIQYKFNTLNNIVYVPVEDVQKAKMKLTSAGVQHDDGMSYSFLNDQSGFGTSQFLENMRYLRALESDLAKTISSIEGISAAQVHIAIPQNNTFADQDDKVTASIVVTMAPGLESDKEKIRSIIQIVASSVPMLDPKNVTITDQYGHLLTNALDSSSLFSTEQLNYQKDVQNYYEKRIESMISPMLGQSNMSVKVYANLDFTQQEEAKEEFDPNKVERSEQISSQENGSSASGTPGALSNTPPEDTGAAPTAGGTSSSNTSSQTVRNYEVGKSVSYTKSNAGKIKSLSVAVVVDNDVIIDPKTHETKSVPVSKEKIDKITDLVKATIGYDKDRGDQVTVVNSPFVPLPAQPVTNNNHFWEQVWFFEWIKRVIGIVFGFGVLIFIYRNLHKFTRPIEQPKLDLKQDIIELVTEDHEDELKKSLKDMKTEGFKKLKDMAAMDPNRIASIIKVWVGKS